MMPAAASGPPIFGSAPAGVVCHKRLAAYAIIAGAEGRIAVVRGRMGYWLPGGGALPGEAPEETVAREVREELGHRVRLVGKIGEAIQYFYASDDECWYEMKAVFFRAEIEGERLGTAEHELYWLDAGNSSESFFHACHAWAVSRACGEWK
jgi:8-oxo-dGTP pyrophosphatase MutT (NUDIX family)